MSLAALASIGTGVAANLWANNEAAKKNKEAAEKNAETQREFAQSGIKWKVQDAKEAGIHPLYALSSNTPSFTPSYVGDTSSSQLISDMGQNVSRAIQATQSTEERAANQLRLESMKLDNDLKKAELAKNTASQIGPALPNPGDNNFIPGQGNSLVKDRPLERIAPSPGRPGQEAGWRSDVSFSRGDGALYPMVPESLSESLEDDIIGKLQWRWRNQILPNFSEARQPDITPPPGADGWVWSYSQQGWVPGIIGLDNKRLYPMPERYWDPRYQGR